MLHFDTRIQLSKFNDDGNNLAAARPDNLSQNEKLILLSSGASDFILKIVLTFIAFPSKDYSSFTLTSKNFYVQSGQTFGSVNLRSIMLYFQMSLEEYNYSTLNRSSIAECLSINNNLLIFNPKLLPNPSITTRFELVDHFMTSLKFASEEEKNNKEYVLAAVYQNGMDLEFANYRLKTDEEVVLTAVQQNGMALQFASRKLKGDSRIMSRAIRQNKKADQFAWYQ